MHKAMPVSTDYCLCVPRGPHVVGLLIGSVFLATWLLERFGVIDLGGLAFVGAWTLFVFGFVFPVCLLLLYLTLTREPIIKIAEDNICLRHVGLPWKSAVLSASEIN